MSAVPTFELNDGNRTYRTAFDIASKGIANEHRLIEAIGYAEVLASNRPARAAAAGSDR